MSSHKNKASDPTMTDSYTVVYCGGAALETWAVQSGGKDERALVLPGVRQAFTKEVLLELNFEKSFCSVRI